MSWNELDPERYVERQMELLETMTVHKAGNWFEGIIADCEFYAKVYQNGSKYGINGGRVSKLSVRRKVKGITGASRYIINYDRGWDMEPEADEDRLILDTLVEYFENLPEEEQHADDSF